MRNRYVRALLLASLLILTMALPKELKAAGFDIADSRFNIGLRLAYGQYLKSPPVHLYSLLPRWGIFLVHPHGSPLPGGLGISFELEGILSLAKAQNTGWEIGVTPLLKFTLPLTQGLHLFLEGGAGVIGEFFDNPAVPHALNFTPQLGAGLDLALTQHLGLTLAYRFRHSSSAGLYKENPPFNVQFFQAGLIYFY